MHKRAIRNKPGNNKKAAITNKESRLLKTIARLKKRVRVLLDERRRLRQRVKELNEMLFKPSGTRTKEDLAEPTIPKKRGAKPGHPGTTRPKPREVDEEIEVHATSCPRCKSKHIKKCNHQTSHTQEDIVLPRVKVTKYIHGQYYCLDCKKTFNSGPGKDEIPGSYVGPTALSLGSFMHYVLRIPYETIADLFKKIFQMNITSAAIYGFDKRARKKCLGIYKEIKKKLRSQKYVHADETGWRNDGKPFWLWGLATLDLVFYQINKKRKASVVQEILGLKFLGVIISDFLATYGKLLFTKQKCLVHLLRLLKRLKERYQTSGKVRDFCDKLDKLVHKILELHKIYKAKKITKLEFFQLAADIKSQIKSLLKTVLPFPRADRVRRNLDKCRTELTTCLDKPEVPPHNNHIERQLRPNVVIRKISGGTRSQSGMDNHQVLMSVMQTASLNKYPVLDLLRKVHSGVGISLSELQQKPPP